MAIEFGRVVPTFRIFSVEKAREFYLGFLGFKVDWEHRFEPDLPVYMQVSRGGLVFHLSEHHGDGTPGSTAYVYMTGVEALHRELSEKKYKYNRPGIQKQDWGMLELQVVDPFSNRITFGEPYEKPYKPYKRWRPMPELPEVETVRRGLAPVMEGARFDKVTAHRGDLRWPLPKDFVKRVEGTTVTGMGRRAKYLLADLSSGDVLVMHLGMSGSFRVIENDEAKTPGQFHHERGKPSAHDHVVFEMSSGATVSFNDPRRFGSMHLVARDKLDEEPLLRFLGPEPLGNEFDAAMLAKACAGKKTSLKAALLDQSVVAGLGNIYVCEALHLSRLSPRRLGSTLAMRSGTPHERTAPLVDSIKSVLNAAIKAGGSSLRDHRQTSGELGYFQHNFRVYDREGQPCVTPGCGGIVRRFTQNGRSTFYCRVCQK